MPKCRICKQPFTKIRPLQPTCNEYDCKVAYATNVANKAIEKKKKREKRELKEKTKTLKDYLKELQVVFNKYIRLRDEGLPCVSCQRHHKGQYHAGHYRSVGAAPQLRFNELNVNKQCSACNNHKSGNVVEYRINLIKKIGIDAVEWLEAENKPAKYSVSDVLQLKKHYSQKIKEIEHS